MLTALFFPVALLFATLSRVKAFFAGRLATEPSVRGLPRGAKRTGHQITGGSEKPNNAARTFFNTVHLLPKDFMFEYGGAKLSCPESHLTSVRPCLHQKSFCSKCFVRQLPWRTFLIFVAILRVKFINPGKTAF